MHKFCSVKDYRKKWLQMDHFSVNPLIDCPKAVVLFDLRRWSTHIEIACPSHEKAQKVRSSVTFHPLLCSQCPEITLPGKAVMLSSCLVDLFG